MMLAWPAMKYHAESEWGKMAGAEGWGAGAGSIVVVDAGSDCANAVAASHRSVAKSMKTIPRGRVTGGLSSLRG
jgi:hypothetical protein